MVSNASDTSATRAARNGAGELILISCYELGHEPLGLVVPAAVLERHGFVPRLLDVSVEEFVEENLLSAKLIGISVPMHTALRLGVRVARRIREINPGCHICFYGLYAELNQEYLESIGADTCLGAEFEADLVRVAETVFGGREPASPAVDERREHAPLLPRRGALSARHSYAKLWNNGEITRVGYVAATRGCKHHCRHCPLPASYNGRFHAVAVDDVLADVGQCVAAGAGHITFADPDFLNGPTHARRIGRAFHDAFPGVTFDYTAKVEHLLRQPELVEALQRNGCLFVVSAVESFNDTVLSALAKGHTRADALAVFDHFRRIDLALRPTLVPFTPWETLESFIELLDTVASEGLIEYIDPVQYSIRLLVPPGSLLLESPEFTPHAGPLDPERFTHAWSHPDPRMDALQRRVAGIVETRATAGEEDSADPFALIYAAALETAGRSVSSDTPPPPPRDRRKVSPHPPPHLTEPWFC